MNKIKKQFKAFWAYFCLTERGAGTVETGKRMRGYVWSLLIIIVAFIVPAMQMGLGFSVYEGVVLGAAMGVGICTAVKPSALSVAPFSPKQRMVFSFLSVLLMSLIAIAFIFAISMVFVLFIAFIAFCINGENIFASALPTEYYSAYGNAFTILSFTLIFFAVYAIFYMERKRNVTIASIVFLVATEIFTLVMTNLCGNARNSQIVPLNEFHFCTYSNVPVEIDYLNAPWGPILLLSILNVLAIAAAVFMTIRRFKSDKV